MSTPNPPSAHLPQPPPDGTSKHLGIPHIPIEILRHIALYLDVPSALALARTCRTLRDAGESKVWEVVDVTSGYNPLNQKDPLTLDDYARRQEVVKSRLLQITSSIASHPYRLECIQTLRLEVSNALADGLLALARSVVPYLLRLDLTCLPLNDLIESDHSNQNASIDTRLDLELKYHSSSFLYSLVSGLVSGIDTPWHRVTNLKIAIPRDLYRQDPNTLRLLPKLFPNVVDLSISSAEEEYDYSSPPPLPMPSVRRLTFTHLADEDISSHLLASIVDNAPDLEFVRILTTGWDPRKSDVARLALSKKTLKSLVLLTAEGLDYDRVGRVPLLAEEVVCEDSSLDETNELCFENIQFPKLPITRHLTVLTGPRMDNNEYISLGVGARPGAAVNAINTISRPTLTAPSGLPTGHISPVFIRYLHRAPLLEWIKLHYEDEPLPSMHKNHPIEPEYFVPPCRWEKEGFRGAIIRRYVPSASDGDNKWEGFWHIRTLSRAIDHPTGPAYVGARRVWRDFTHYKGRTVPYEVVVEAYRAAGMEMDWLDGGREMVFGRASRGGGEGSGDVAAAGGAMMGATAGFAVLQGWRDSVGDESDIEEFEATDEESDFDSDEDDDEEDEDEDGFAMHGQELVEILQGVGFDEDDDGNEDGWETDGEGDSDDPLGMW